jgi:selenoprotein W-related protein
VSLTAELLKELEPHLASIEVVPSHGGVFEVEANGELLFSKKASGRHAEAGEVLRLVRAKVHA